MGSSSVSEVTQLECGDLPREPLCGDLLVSQALPGRKCKFWWLFSLKAIEV